ncbi:MAG TPA: 3-deoxy-D-manno-octulosonic acid transferase, partial [Pirellulales bacterium]|nr:3-deoxy-D-manno-octulosonic acid transferase [Pirellulales bacterium]
GSLSSRGGQNMIEPAAYGAAICFGPATHNFRDVVSLLVGARAATVVADGEELAAFVRRCLDEPAFATELGNRAREVVAAQRGATARTVERLAALVDNPTRPAPAADPRHAA